MAVSFVQAKATTGTTSLTITLDSSPTVGNVMYAFFGSDDASDTVSTLSGWVVMGSPQAAGSDARHFAFRRVVQSGDSTGYTWSTGGSSQQFAGAIIEVAGADTTTPERSVTEDPSAGSSSSHSTPTFSAEAGDMIIWAYTVDKTSETDPDFIGTPSGMDERYEIRNTGSNLYIGGSTEAVSSTLTSVTRSLTMGSADDLSGHVIVVRVAAGGTELDATGTAAGTSTATASAKLTIELNGSASGTSTVTGNAIAVEIGPAIYGEAVYGAAIYGEAPTELEATATAAGTSTVAGSVKLTETLSATAAGTSTVSGAVKLLESLAGSLAGTSTVTGNAELLSDTVAIVLESFSHSYLYDSTIDVPTGTEVGDVLIALFFYEDDTPPGSVDGFTYIADYGGNEWEYASVQYRIVDGLEGSTFDLDYPVAGAVMGRFSGVDTSDPLASNASGNVAYSVASIDLPAVSAEDGSTLVMLGAYNASNSQSDFTFGGIQPELEDTDDSNGWGIALEEITSTGSTGTRTVESTPNDSFYYVGMVALNPFVDDGALSATATAAGTSTAAASAKQTKELAATSAGTSTSTASAKLSEKITAAAAGTSTVAGTAYKILAATASSAGTSTVAGAVKLTDTATATAAGTSTAAGSLKLTETLSATAAGTSTAAANATVDETAQEATAAATGTSSATASAKLTVKTTATAAGTSAIAAAAKLALKLTAASDGTSTVTGYAVTGSQLTATASAAGTSTAAGSAKLTEALYGTSAGTSTVTGDTALQIDLLASAAGSSTAAADAKLLIDLSATADGTSTANALLVYFTNITMTGRTEIEPYLSGWIEVAPELDATLDIVPHMAGRLEIA